MIKLVGLATWGARMAQRRPMIIKLIIFVTNEEEIEGRGKRKIVVYLVVNGRRCERRSLVYQWSSFITWVINKFLKSIVGVMNDGH